MKIIIIGVVGEGTMPRRISSIADARHLVNIRGSQSCPFSCHKMPVTSNHPEI
jgi:hypothetical protein